MLQNIDNLSDRAIVEEFNQKKVWGMETQVNIYGADKKLISDKECIRQFVISLCDVIDMKRFGEPFIERFGSGNLMGYSLCQMIHTSCISAHFAEEDGRIFLNIFSCKAYEPGSAAKFASNWFSGERVEYQTVLRD